MVTTKTISDTQAEAGIIATLIYNPLFYLHNEQLKHSHFYNEESACLYWGISKLLKQGVENIDAFNLSTVLNSAESVKNTFNKYNINLNEYIDLSKNIVRNSLEEYRLLVNRVLALAFKRELSKKLKKIENICLDVDQENIFELSDNIYNILDKLNEEYILNSNDEIKLLGEELDDIWDDIRNDSKNPKAILVPKLPSLKNYFTYTKGEVIMLVARYKQGKSAILMNEALYQAQQGHTVVYLDSEMKKKEFVIRALANVSQIDVKKIKDGSYTASEEQILNESLKLLKTYKLIHKYKPSWTEHDLYSTVKILQHKHGVGFFVFDYIKAHAGDANQLYNRLGAISDYIKNDIAGGLDIPVLTAAQLNRNGEISDSDKLARHVSTVVYWRQKTKKEMDGGNWRKVGNGILNVRTNRLGEQMTEDEGIHCVFDGNKMSIYEAPEQPRDCDVDL